MYRKSVCVFHDLCHWTIGFYIIFCQVQRGEGNERERDGEIRKSNNNIYRDDDEEKRAVNATTHSRRRKKFMLIRIYYTTRYKHAGYFKFHFSIRLLVTFYDSIELNLFVL